MEKYNDDGIAFENIFLEHTFFNRRFMQSNENLFLKAKLVRKKIKISLDLLIEYF
jgi:hypothetical protein